MGYSTPSGLNPWIQLKCQHFPYCKTFLVDLMRFNDCLPSHNCHNCLSNGRAWEVIGELRREAPDRGDPDKSIWIQINHHPKSQETVSTFVPGTRVQHVPFLKDPSFNWRTISDEFEGTSYLRCNNMLCMGWSTISKSCFGVPKAPQVTHHEFTPVKKTPNETTYKFTYSSHLYYVCIYIYISWYIPRMQQKKKTWSWSWKSFFLRQSSMTVPLPHFQRFASNFRPTSKKASCDSNPSPFLWLYSNPSPFLWWAVAVFFRRCLAMMVSPSPPPLQQRSRDLPPDQDLIFEALQVPSAVAAFKSKMSYQNIQHFQRFGHVEKYPMKLMKLREWDFDIGFMQWDMFLFLIGPLLKKCGSSLKWCSARSSKWSILDKELSQIDLADLKKAAPI